MIQLIVDSHQQVLRAVDVVQVQTHWQIGSLYKTIWAIVDRLRGAMNADDFRGLPIRINRELRLSKGSKLPCTINSALARRQIRRLPLRTTHR